jgi:GINS complex subunit 4
MMKKLHESDCSLNVNCFQMRQLLGQEKMAPELLPYQHALVETIIKQVNQKDREIQKRAAAKRNNSDERFYLNILRMEMERIKYMLKAYLRARIVKIEKHLLYIVEKDKASLLSPGEMEYAWTLYESKKEHFKSEFFDKISKKLNNMEDDI